MREMKSMSIGKVAKQAGVNRKTIRYYEKIGLLPEPERNIENNYRLYSEDTVRLLKFIKKAQNFGFSLDQIKEIISLRQKGLIPCLHVLELLRNRISDIESKIAELAKIRDELKRIEGEWKSVRSPEDDTEDGVCPQIEKIGESVGRLQKTPKYPEV